jgi:hypothetical protein
VVLDSRIRGNDVSGEIHALPIYLTFQVAGKSLEAIEDGLFISVPLV